MHSHPLFVALITILVTGCTADKSDSSENIAPRGDTASEGEVADSGEPTVEDSGEPTVEDSGDPSPAGPTIWSGPTITFTKADSADPTDPANQDAITDLVVLTRGNRGSLMNVVSESSANNSSPAGTQWAQGTTEAIEGLEFTTLKVAANNNMRNAPGTPFVLHLIDEDIYIDVTFLTWTSGNSGGGFSYQRSTPAE